MLLGKGVTWKAQVKTPKDSLTFEGQEKTTSSILDFNRWMPIHSYTSGFQKKKNHVAILSSKSWHIHNVLLLLQMSRC